MGTDNAELADWINKNLDYDQLILEFYTPGEPNSGWIHCSWIPDQPRKHSYMHTNQRVKQNTNLLLVQLKT